MKNQLTNYFLNKVMKYYSLVWVGYSNR